MRKVADLFLTQGFDRFEHVASQWKAALFLLILLLSSSRPSQAQTKENIPADATFTISRDVVYAHGPNGPLMADVYVPTGEAMHPGILFIHGGGWKNGNRNQMITLIKPLAEDGYVCFTIEYDVDPVTFPASFNESLAALRFFREHAREYHLDPAHIAVMGSSAGGELAALVALNPEGMSVGPTPKSGSDRGVQAAVILNGVLDLSDLERNNGADLVSPYLGGSCAQRMDSCRAASPLFQVHAGAPPFYVGHGTADKTVPFAEAVAFTNALKAAQVPVQFYQADGGGHTFWAYPQFFAANLQAVKEFLAIHLREMNAH